MNDVDASTILTAAITSAFVSLGIEWAAKPRLEARKERILQGHRAREAFRRDVIQVSVRAAKLNQPWPRSGTEEQRRALRDEKQRIYEQMEAATQTIADTVADYCLTYPTARIRNLISWYAAVVHGIVISDRTQADQAAIVRELSESLYDMLFVRWWHLLHRERQMRELKTVLQKYAPDG
jgi:hypothetical protein